MSYDINLFAPIPGEDPILSAKRDVEESDLNQPLSLETKSRNARIVSRLVTLNSNFEVNELDSGTEINWLHNDCAFQLFLAESSGTLNMPYWSENQDQEIFDLIATSLKIVHEETGFLAYDPQSEELIALDGHSTISTQLFGVGVNVLEKIIPGKPWWKFW